MSKRYRSRYIVEVGDENSYIELVDSTGCKYYVDKQSAAFNEFKVWFKTVFIAGLNQHLTVFSYTQMSNDGQIINIIEKFINVEKDN